MHMRHPGTLSFRTAGRLLVGLALVAGALATGRTAPAGAQYTSLQLILNGPFTGQPNQIMTMTATALQNGVPLQAPVTYQWNFGDGSLGTGQSVTHAYTNAGTYTISVIASTSTGLSGYATSTAQIGITGSGALQISAGGPYSGQPGVPVSFSAQLLGTLGMGPTQVLFQWVFGDGGTGFGQTVTHVYAVAGTYSVTVAVTTSDQQLGTATTTAVIGGYSGFGQSGASAGGPYTAIAGQPVTLVGTLYTGTAITYSWNFGDGNYGSGQSVVKTYATPGTYYVTLTVVSSTGQSSIATTTVTVTSAAGATTTGPTEQLALYAVCNNVAVTWPNGASIATVAAAVSPTAALNGIWRFNNASQTFSGWSPAPGAPVDLLTVSRAEPVFICMNAPGTFTRPVI